MELSRSPSGIKPKPPRWKIQRLALRPTVGATATIVWRLSIFLRSQEAFSHIDVSISKVLSCRDRMAGASMMG